MSACAGPGGDITASSVGGSIDVTSDKLERARLESVTGAVRFTGNIIRGGALEAETHSADVELRFLGGLDAEVTMVSVAGHGVQQAHAQGQRAAQGKDRGVHRG